MKKAENKGRKMLLKTAALLFTAVFMLGAQPFAAYADEGEPAAPAPITETAPEPAAPAAEPAAEPAPQVQTAVAEAAPMMLAAAPAEEAPAPAPEIQVEAGEGDDTVTVATGQDGSVEVNGGEGDDTLAAETPAQPEGGSEVAVDVTLRGEEGNDELSVTTQQEQPSVSAQVSENGGETEYTIEADGADTTVTLAPGQGAQVETEQPAGTVPENEPEEEEDAVPVVYYYDEEGNMVIVQLTEEEIEASGGYLQAVIDQTVNKIKASADGSVNIHTLLPVDTTLYIGGGSYTEDIFIDGSVTLENTGGTVGEALKGLNLKAADLDEALLGEEEEEEEGEEEGEEAEETAPDLIGSGAVDLNGVITLINTMDIVMSGIYLHLTGEDGSSGGALVLKDDTNTTYNATTLDDSFVVVSDGSENLTLNTGEGDDNVTLLAKDASVSVDLGEGDDTLAAAAVSTAQPAAGSDSSVRLDGGDGDDTLVLEDTAAQAAGSVVAAGGSREEDRGDALHMQTRNSAGQLQDINLNKLNQAISGSTARNLDSAGLVKLNADATLSLCGTRLAVTLLESINGIGYGAEGKDSTELWDPANKIKAYDVTISSGSDAKGEYLVAKESGKTVGQKVYLGDGKEIVLAFVDGSAIQAGIATGMDFVESFLGLNDSSMVADLVQGGLKTIVAMFFEFLCDSITLDIDLNNSYFMSAIRILGGSGDDTVTVKNLKAPGLNVFLEGEEVTFNKNSQTVVNDLGVTAMNDAENPFNVFTANASITTQEGSSIRANGSVDFSVATSQSASFLNLDATKFVNVKVADSRIDLKGSIRAAGNVQADANAFIVVEADSNAYIPTAVAVIVADALTTLHGGSVITALYGDVALESVVKAVVEGTAGPTSLIPAALATAVVTADCKTIVEGDITAGGDVILSANNQVISDMIAANGESTLAVTSPVQGENADYVEYQFGEGVVDAEGTNQGSDLLQAIIGLLNKKTGTAGAPGGLAGKLTKLDQLRLYHLEEQDNWYIRFSTGFCFRRGRNCAHRADLLCEPFCKRTAGSVEPGG